MVGILEVDVVNLRKVALEVTEGILPSKVHIRKRCHAVTSPLTKTLTRTVTSAFSPASLALITNDPTELFTYDCSAFLSYLSYQRLRPVVLLVQAVRLERNSGAC